MLPPSRYCRGWPRHEFPDGADSTTCCAVPAVVTRSDQSTFDTDDPDGHYRQTGTRWRDVRRDPIHHTANPTMLKAGYKLNVIPAKRGISTVASCPGRNAFDAENDEIIGLDISRGAILNCSLQTTPSTYDPVEAMMPPARRRPGARTVPYMAVWGYRCEGLCQARHPVLRRGRCDPADQYRAPSSTESTNRVPVEALHFGTQVLEHSRPTADPERT